ncbi:MAG: glycosyltransferase family 2 protein, partial [Pseudomonadota bacterium]
ARARPPGPAAGGDVILRRDLRGAIIGGLKVLDAVAAPDGTVRTFYGAGTDPARVADAGARVTSVNGALMVTGVPAGVDPAPAEPAVFAGRRVLMGMRNGEDGIAVGQWLAHHAGQGFDGALILDRARPGEAPLEVDAIPKGMVVAVVGAPLPLGGGGPSERHPVTAPDAPGRDRMERPADDPWTAPMGEWILLEALRWRFLSDAAAVAFLDVSDLILDGPAVLDALAAAEVPVVPLTGRRIYPWRVRPGRRVGFGDHVCRPFDAADGHRRWIADPRRVPGDVPFRVVRVGGLRPDPGNGGAFLRAMGLRVSEGGDLPLAPKTSLVLDDGLLAMARDGFGADPVLPPATEAATRARPAAEAGRTAIVTCMKNEGPFVLEWLAHHRAIGVDDVLIYTNDCTDGTDALLDLLQDQGVVQHRANPFREIGEPRPQHAALTACVEEPVIADADWTICMDVDEFVDIHVGAGHLRDLFAAVGDANMISLTWRLFGNAGHTTFEEALTPARFTRCAPELIRKPHQAWGFKTLFRNLGLYKKMGVHRPKGLRPESWRQVRWVNGSGRPMPRGMLRNGWRSTLRTYGYGLATLNHYAVRDAESFLVKRDRGRVNHVERDQGLGYWFRMNNNAEESTSFRRHLPALKAEMARLKALPGVAAQHDACVAAHRAKIAELRETPAFAAFHAEITGDRMARLSRMHTHFGANVFLAGPDCVPDEVAFGEHAPDFTFTVGDVDEAMH